MTARLGYAKARRMVGASDATRERIEAGLVGETFWVTCPNCRARIEFVFPNKPPKTCPQCGVIPRRA